MIVFNNWNLTVIGLVARQYDNLSRRIDVEGDLPDGYTWQLLVQSGGNADTLLLQPTEKGVGAVLTADNLSKSGEYYFQLRGVLEADGVTKRHTNVVSAYIPESLTGLGTWPEVPTEFAQVEARILELYQHPPIPGSNGFWLVWDADKDEYVESQLALPEAAAGGTSDHSKLKNRDAADQHPMSAIAGLEKALEGKQAAGIYLTDKDLDATLTVEGKAADAKAVGDALSTLSDENLNPVARTAEMTQSVGVDADGALWAEKDKDINQLKQDLSQLSEEAAELKTDVFDVESIDMSTLNWKYGSLTISGGITGTSKKNSMYAVVNIPSTGYTIENVNTDLSIITYILYDASGNAIGQRETLTWLRLSDNVASLKVAIKKSDNTDIETESDIYGYLSVSKTHLSLVKKVNGLSADNGELELTGKDIQIEKLESVTGFNGGYITTNVSVGDIINTNPTVSSGWNYIILPVLVGDKFVVTGTSGNNPKVWAFTDDSYVLVSRSNSNVTDAVIIAPVNGYLIVNHNVSAPKRLDKVATESVADAIERVENKIQVPQKPLVSFEFDHNLRDVSTYMSLIDYSDSHSVPVTVCNLFDSLVTEYPDYVTMFDLAEHLGIPYPVYANGVSGSDVYLDTPRYRVNCYKLSCSNLGAGNENENKKKKMLLVSGVHGSENAAPFNTYLFAKYLCDIVDENAFKLRASFDIWIVPYVNWYSGYHKDIESARRVNANGVNINRNYPISAWVESGEGTFNYTGPSAGSEFETQLIVGLTNEIKPDMCVDHHNYMFEDQQFYTDVSSNKAIRPAHQALVDCSYAFIKGMPKYFGNKYKLFTPDRNISSAPNKVSLFPSISCVWWGEQGVYMPTLIEVCDRIRYVNGEVDSTHLANGVFTADAFSVADYTLRNQILHFAQAVLDKE